MPSRTAHTLLCQLTRSHVVNLSSQHDDLECLAFRLPASSGIFLPPPPAVELQPASSAQLMQLDGTSVTRHRNALCSTPACRKAC